MKKILLTGIISAILMFLIYCICANYYFSRSYSIEKFNDNCKISSRVYFAKDKYFYGHGDGFYVKDTGREKKISENVDGCHGIVLENDNLYVRFKYGAIEKINTVTNELEHFQTKVGDPLRDLFLSYSYGRTLHFGDDIELFVDNLGFQKYYINDGMRYELTSIPSHYLASFKNMYYKNGYVYALLQNTDTSPPHGGYNAFQRVHHTDAIAKIDVRADTCEILYETDSKDDRIVAYTEDMLVLANNNKLIFKNLKNNTIERTERMKIRHDYIFEVCNNRIFVWDGSYKLIGSYDMQADMKE